MKDSRRGKFALLFVLLGLSMSLHTNALAEAPYKVGYINSHSGFMAFLGTAWRDGFLLAVDEVNQAGGINGRKMEVVVYDDESNVAKGVLAFKKLIDTDKADILAGANHSGVAVACAPIAEEAKVPFFATNSTRWSIARPNKWKLPEDPVEVFDYVTKFRVDAQPHLEAMYEFLKKHGVRKFAWMSAGTAFGRGAREIMEATYKRAGMELTAAEEYGPNDSDMTSQLTRIKGKEFDGMIVYSAEPAGVLVYKQARELGIDKPIIADAPIVTTSIMKTLGQYLGGLYVCVHVPDVPDLSILPKELQPMAPVVERVRSGVQKKYNHPADWTNAMGYDAAMLVADTLKRSGADPGKLSESRKKIRDAMVSGKGFVGAYAMGDITPHHELMVPVVIIKLSSDQKFEVAK